MRRQHSPRQHRHRNDKRLNPRKRLERRNLEKSNRRSRRLTQRQIPLRHPRRRRRETRTQKILRAKRHYARLDSEGIDVRGKASYRSGRTRQTSVEETEGGGGKTILDTHKIREDFPILKRKINDNPLIYFDNAATTQKPKQVIEAEKDFYENQNA